MEYISVIGTQRSGTTVLRSLLDSHPDIKAFGEVFLPRHKKQKECFYHFLKNICLEDIEYVVPSPETNSKLFNLYLEYLEGLTKGSTLISIDCKYNFLLGALSLGEDCNRHKPFLLERMRKNNFHIIHLKRKNVLASLVSSKLSTKNQVWATNDLSRLKHNTIYLPCENLLSDLKSRVANNLHFSTLLAGKSTLEINYEDMFNDESFSSELLNTLAEFLNIPNSFNPEPLYLKMTSPLSEAIENFDEVHRVLSGTEFESMLLDQ